MRKGMIWSQLQVIKHQIHDDTKPYKNDCHTNKCLIKDKICLVRNNSLKILNYMKWSDINVLECS
ncbi:hypothetical protein [Clostridium botulinum]|uniref:hypothetical protein n=1 Tax=Clostridium botulinum TaxID=1491 RepID=UPI0004D6D8B6|nr:hypothetical protein [Clostridium botulinum]KEH99745.1 hypothetical protein Z952_p0069 [Clostridium botulinum C/D str. BKT75002]KEI05223.1 hypothetical protein Z954_0069 [Clostridium botulinum C/D str. BKT2873]